MMHTNEIVQARTNLAAKAEAERVLAAMGLTVSDAFQMMIFALPPKRGSAPIGRMVVS